MSEEVDWGYCLLHGSYYLGKQCLGCWRDYLGWRERELLKALENKQEFDSLPPADKLEALRLHTLGLAKDVESHRSQKKHNWWQRLIHRRRYN